MKLAKTNRKAFTLVELLVVIAVIALLLAMLMPALNAARERARQVVCLANVRQLGLASQMYASSTGYMPIYSEMRRAYGYPNYYYHSDPLVGPSVRGSVPEVTEWDDPCACATPGVCLIKNGDLVDSKIFDGACPSSKPYIRISYGYNYGQLGSASSAYGEMEAGNEWVRITEVELPSETGMFADGPTWGWDPSAKPLSGGWGIPYWEPAFWPDVEPGDDEWDPMYGPYQIKGHRDGTSININFVDGHGASMPPELLHSTRSHDRYDDKIYIWKRDKDWP